MIDVREQYARATRRNIEQWESTMTSYQSGDLADPQTVLVALQVRVLMEVYRELRTLNSP